MVLASILTSPIVLRLQPRVTDDRQTDGRTTTLNVNRTLHLILTLGIGQFLLNSVANTVYM